jgi:hypothetical protein
VEGYAVKLKIGHLTYKVRAADYEADSGEISTDDWGLCIPLTQEILIDPDLSSARQLEILLHEIIHAIWEAYLLPATVEEEEAAGMLGRFLSAVLTDNPILLKAIEQAKRGVCIVT